MNQINILWSFSSIEASISEIFAIKNCYVLARIFIERSEKLLENIRQRDTWQTLTSLGWVDQVREILSSCFSIESGQIGSEMMVFWCISFQTNQNYGKNGLKQLIIEERTYKTFPCLLGPLCQWQLGGKFRRLSFFGFTTWGAETWRRCFFQQILKPIQNIWKVRNETVQGVANLAWQIKRRLTCSL